MNEATLFLDLDGTTLTGEEEQLLSEPEIGGVILFARNTENAQQVSSLIKEIRRVDPELVVSIDQEGGRVQRLKEGVTRLPAMQAFLPLYRTNPERALFNSREIGYLMATELRLLDVDISFAPVLDVDYGRNTVIANRAFATEPQSVVELSRAFIEGVREAGMPVTGKHFPGHGWANADTHHAGAVDERSFEEIWRTDLLPFKDAIGNGMEAMMFAHVHYANCDSNPAGFSSFWIQEVLRQKLKFKGIVFSDDLSMKAAHSAGGYSQRAEQAVLAGCQVLLCCNDREGTLEVLQYMKANDFCEVSSLNSMRGKLVTPKYERLEIARLLAMELCG